MNLGAFQLIPQDVAGALLCALAVFVLVFHPYIF